MFTIQSMAQAFDLQGVEAQRRWDTLAAILTPSGTEPHWRRRPSVFEQLRGGIRQPMARKDANREKGGHGHFKAAASADTYGLMGWTVCKLKVGRWLGCKRCCSLGFEVTIRPVALNTSKEKLSTSLVLIYLSLEDGISFSKI